MIGIDIGGANLKVVDDAGVHIHYCPLWQGAPLADLLEPYAEPAAVVMSGELADCFSSKIEGIRWIVDAVQGVIPDAAFYGTDAAFHARPVPALAAANWLASADYLRGEYADAVLLDVGSTTADVIPLNCFEDLKGLTDTRRLQKQYLVYTGMLRTNVATILSSVTLDGTVTPVSTEYFAASADAHLVLGHIAPVDYTCPAPDNGEKTVDAALRRLARVVCADIDEIGNSGGLQVARQFWEAQRTLIVRAVGRALFRSGAERVITAGVGAEIFARELAGITLEQEIGEVADALPAYAVREVALRRAACD
ncbi:MULTISPECIES: hydantoinase/oxoprolinase family protein [unclassified Methanoculleus]|uniref:hydantoinase/oxoprolinase family protein n=1 Tax=unclassified Methanoculleus TaxID=2619537 RepID=UPI0025EBB78F|nr:MULTISPECIES: hydantoinase/oxoprolinase family protein [unclassified Methanoculleus]MCK9317063.1 H4MPT-linked C1 transfer pathway protein [Methanoculleus sp.]MDD2254661.1 hydantoinase/oxoprolinase family protein [Methanoculleus sp.]MDD2787378.1 hydantoinase/oxoprolinase family protein [Methanoculleus sp.]MDD3214975.1 hydantoinase/oxoprolinase family protein [Methanoculleus sp.]MDD4315154.1 hydantoinase/oxoprolinase family protein [Methanoculleus sp.]